MNRVAVFCGDRGIPALGPSGASHHLRAVCAALAQRGLDVRLATPVLADDRGEHGSLGSVRHVGSSPRSWRWLRGWRERGETWDGRALAAAARDDGPTDLIWERHALFVDGGLRWARAEDVPRVVELNAPLSLERPNVRDPAYAARMEAESLQAADQVFAVSRWLAGWAVSERGCAPDRVVHLPNGTDVRPGDRARGRDRLGIDGPIAVWLGSCKPWHGLDRLPDLVDALPDWTAVVAGSGPEAVPTHDRIRALGRVEGAALDDLLAAADVGLNLTDPAVMPWVCPLKILDYRAAGLPVLSTAAGDAAELVGDQGIVFDAWTTAEAAEAARALLERPRVPAPRTWDQVVDEGLVAIERPTGGSAPRPPAS